MLHLEIIMRLLSCAAARFIEMLSHWQQRCAGSGSDARRSFSGGSCQEAAAALDRSLRAGTRFLHV